MRMENSYLHYIKRFKYFNIFISIFGMFLLLCYPKSLKEYLITLFNIVLNFLLKECIFRQAPFRNALNEKLTSRTASCIGKSNIEHFYQE